jgi:hypothetical protein
MTAPAVVHDASHPDYLDLVPESRRNAFELDDTR